MGDRLIQEVKRRPILWDPKNKHHANRIIVDFEWLQVAEAVNETRETVKTKWKNIKDSFRKELKKAELAKLQDDGNKNWRPHWIHFESMQFLRHIMKPKCLQDIDNTNLEETSPLKMAKDEIKQELEIYNSDSESYQFNVNCNQTGTCSESENAAVNVDLPNKEVLYNQNNLEGSENSWSAVEMSVNELDPITRMSRKRKLQSTSVYIDYMRELLHLKTKKVDLLKERSKEEFDDDMNFFKSLLPHVKQLPAINKLIFRSQVQNA
ncbi:hypothetical protein L9F63_009058, partial [Diploptera punctata]